MKHRFESSAPLWLSALSLLLAPSASLARISTQTPAQAPAQPAAKSDDSESEFEALLQRVGNAQKAYYDEMRALYSKFDKKTATAEEQAAFDKKAAELQKKDPSAAYVREFTELAIRAKGTDVAAKAWMQVLQLGDSIGGPDNPCAKALATLLSDHVRSPVLGELPVQLLYAQSLDRKLRIEALEKLKSESPVDAVKAGALYSLGSVLIAEDATDDERIRARKAFDDLKEHYGSLASPMGKATYGQLVESQLFDIDHLQLGMPIPDFEAVDETGAQFKLSDYAGKVVVVDFWGFW